MIQKIKEKRLYIFILAYLTLALIGSSAISAGEVFYFEYSNNDSLGPNGYFSSINHNIDWLARVKLKKSNGYSNSSMRNRLFCVFTLAGAIAIAINPAGINLKNKKNNIPIIKNLVLLNLRI